MKIENLTPQQLGTVEDFLGELKKSNPQLSWATYSMDEKPTLMDRINQADVDMFLGDKAEPHPIHHGGYEEGIKLRLDQIEEKVDDLLYKLKFIFGDHVLINGRFMNL